jgi:hypothetical protein
MLFFAAVSNHITYQRLAAIEGFQGSSNPSRIVTQTQADLPQKSSILFEPPAYTFVRDQEGTTMFLCYSHPDIDRCPLAPVGHYRQ